MATRLPDLTVFSPLEGRLSWRYGRPDQGTAYELAIITYEGGDTQYVAFPESITVADFKATLRAAQAGLASRRIKSIEFNR